jgi:hypothetical protein
MKKAVIRPMKIQIQLLVDNNVVKEDVLELEEQKVEHLNEDELEAAIEINIRDWIDKMVQVSWEVVES